MEFAGVSNGRPAVYALGNCYIMGEGVPESFYNGIHKVQEAAENGLEAAQVSMADYLLTSSLRTPKIFIKEFGDFLIALRYFHRTVSLYDAR